MQNWHVLDGLHAAVKPWTSILEAVQLQLSRLAPSVQPAVLYVMGVRERYRKHKLTIATAMQSGEVKSSPVPCAVTFMPG